MRMMIYIIGTLIMIAGLAYAAMQFDIASQWIIAGAVIIAGIGLMGAASSARSSGDRSVNVVEHKA